MQNQHISKTSKYAGVSWHKQHKKWHAQITFNKKVWHLGYYDNELTAATVYAVACVAMFSHKLGLIDENEREDTDDDDE